MAFPLALQLLHPVRSGDFRYSAGQLPQNFSVLVHGSSPFLSEASTAGCTVIIPDKPLHSLRFRFCIRPSFNEKALWLQMLHQVFQIIEVARLNPRGFSSRLDFFQIRRPELRGLPEGRRLYLHPCQFIQGEDSVQMVNRVLPIQMKQGPGVEFHCFFQGFHHEFLKEILGYHHNEVVRDIVPGHIAVYAQPVGAAMLILKRLLLKNAVNLLEQLKMGVRDPVDLFRMIKQLHAV